MYLTVIVSVYGGYIKYPGRPRYSKEDIFMSGLKYNMIGGMRPSMAGLPDAGPIFNLQDLNKNII